MEAKEETKEPRAEPKAEETPEAKAESLEDIKKELGKLPKRKRKRRPGRPKGTGKKPEPEPQPEPGELSPEQAAIACGVTTAEMIFMIGQAVGGDEWKPTDQERQYMVYAWGRYYEMKNITDLPPGVILATAIGMYMAPRLTKPKTQARLIAAYLKVRGWVRKVLGKGKPVEPTAHKVEPEPEAES